MIGSRILQVLCVLVMARPCLGQALPPPAQPETPPDWKSPTQITLRCHATPLQEVIRTLGKTGDMQFTIPQDAWPSAPLITIDATHAAFWPLFLDVCRQAHCDLVPFTDQDNPRHLELTAGRECAALKMPTCQVNGCVIVLCSATRHRRVNYSAPQEPTCSLLVHLWVMVDPKHHRLPGSFGAPITSASDENGLSLLAYNNDFGGTYIDGSRCQIAQGGFSLACPPAAGKRIHRLCGSVRIPVLLKEAGPWEIKDVLNAAPQSKAFAEYRITFQSVTRTQAPAPCYEVVFACTSDSGNALTRPWGPSRETERLLDSLELYGSDGAKLQPSGSEKDGTRYIRRFCAANEQVRPARLVCQAPAESRFLVLPFTFKDVPIPE